jgi:uncharacterized protein (TIGR03437 family)
LFTGNSNGLGIAAALTVRFTSNGTQMVAPAIQPNSTTNQYEVVPLTVNATDQLYPVAFGTGFRNRSSFANVSATIDGVSAQVAYAGAQGSVIGLDQANVLIPSSLAGRGAVNVVLMVDGKASNTVVVNVQ